MIKFSNITFEYFFINKFKPGRLKHVQAIGWYLEEANMAQVSVNITDHDETPIHKVYEEVLKDAEVGKGFLSRFQFFISNLYVGSILLTIKKF